MTRKSPTHSTLTWQQVKDLGEALAPMLREKLEQDLRAVGNDVKAAIQDQNRNVIQRLDEQDERLEKQDGVLNELQANTRKGLLAWSLLVFAGSWLGGIALDVMRSWWIPKR